MRRQLKRQVLLFAGLAAVLLQAACEEPQDTESKESAGDISSSSDEDFSKYALHEFGHAIGLLHEHFHPEVSINWDKKKLK